MAWFQNTVSKRHNGRNKMRGYLFSGRYKAIMFERNGYLSRLIHSVLLSIMWAKIIKVEEGIEDLKKNCVFTCKVH